jgi:hypothetical protein
MARAELAKLERELQSRAELELQSRAELERELQSRAELELQSRAKLERELQSRAELELQSRAKLERELALLVAEHAAIDAQLAGANQDVQRARAEASDAERRAARERLASSREGAAANAALEEDNRFCRASLAYLEAQYRSAAAAVLAFSRAQAHAAKEAVGKLELAAAAAAATSAGANSAAASRAAADAVASLSDEVDPTWLAEPDASTLPLAEVGGVLQAALRDAARALRLRLEADLHLARAELAERIAREAAVERQVLQGKLEEALAALYQQQQATSTCTSNAPVAEPPSKPPDVIREASIADAWPTGAW